MMFPNATEQDEKSGGARWLHGSLSFVHESVPCRHGRIWWAAPIQQCNKSGHCCIFWGAWFEQLVNCVHMYISQECTSVDTSTDLLPFWNRYSLCIGAWSCRGWLEQRRFTSWQMLWRSTSGVQHYAWHNFRQNQDARDHGNLMLAFRDYGKDWNSLYMYPKEYYVWQKLQSYPEQMCIVLVSSQSREDLTLGTLLIEPFVTQRWTLYLLWPKSIVSNAPAGSNLKFADAYWYSLSFTGCMVILQSLTLQAVNCVP